MLKFHFTYNMMFKVVCRIGLYGDTYKNVIVGFIGLYAKSELEVLGKKF